MISTSEAAKRSKGLLSPSQIALLARRGKLSGSQKQSDGTWLISEDSLTQYLGTDTKRRQSFLGKIWSWWERTARLPIILLFILIFNLINNALDFAINTYSISDVVIPGWSLYVNPAKNDEVLILVTKFSGSGDYDPSAWIYSSLYEAIENRGLEKVRVEKIPSEVINAEEAQKLGKRYKATIVIWGNFDNAAILPIFEVTRESDFLSTPEGREPIINVDVKQYNFYIARQLPSEMRYLTLIALGKIYQERKELDLAISVLTDALSIDLSQDYKDKNIEEGLILRAQSYMFSGQLDLAIKDYENVISQNPETSNLVSIYNNLGVIYSSKRDYQKAISFTQQAITLSPDNYGLYLNLGAFYNFQGDATGAKNSYDKSLSLWKEDDGLEKKAWILINYCGIFDGIDDLNSAKSICEEGIKIAPSNPVIYHNYGFFQLSVGNNEKAKELFDQSIVLGSEDPRTFQGRGVAYFNLDRFEEALLDFEKTIEIDPNYGGGYYQRGVLKFTQKDFDGALTDFNKAIEIWPDNILSLHYRAKVYLLLGMPEKAKHDCETILSIDSDYVEAYYMIGTIYHDAKEYEKAIEYYDLAYKKDESFLLALTDRAAAKIGLNKAEEALSDAEISIAKDPYFIPGYIVKAQAYLIMEKYGQVIETCNSISQIDESLKKTTGYSGCYLAKNEDSGEYGLFVIDDEQNLTNP